MEAERPGGDDATADAARPHHGRRGLAITAITLTVVGAVFTGLCLLVLVACWQDDAAIDAHLGQATADVLSSSPSRTAVRFVTPDGTVNIPDTGVLYPQGLIAGERVRVEYDTQNPQLVRVAGRDYQLAFLPVGTAILIAWAVLAPTLWWLRRRRRSAVG
jgi:hypothetical protein